MGRRKNINSRIKIKRNRRCEKKKGIRRLRFKKRIIRKKRKKKKNRGKQKKKRRKALLPFSSYKM